jgi:ubiquinone/menaquinone biosynthesis C-methylase UbiE
MDTDRDTKCWLKDIPYIWTNEERHYIVTDPNQVVYIDFLGKVVPVLFSKVAQFMDGKVITAFPTERSSGRAELAADQRGFRSAFFKRQLIPIYFLYIKNNECLANVAKYFMVFWGIPHEKDNIRINGNPTIQLVPNYIWNIPAQDYYHILVNGTDDFILNNFSGKLLGTPIPSYKYPLLLHDYIEHYFEDQRLKIPTYNDNYTYLITVFPFYPTQIGTKAYQFLFVSKSLYTNILFQLIKKRIYNAPNNLKCILDSNVSDMYKYTALKKYVPSTTGKWGGKNYDPFKISERAWNRINDFKKYLKIDEIKRVLDIGAGNGEILAGIGNYLKISKENLWAVDVKYYGTTELEKRLCFQKVATNNPIKFPNESFDLIMLLQVMHHMIDLDLKLKEVYRLLKPNGLLFIREHDCRNIYVSNLIDIEHMLYDVTLSNTTYKDAINGYTGTIYRSKENWTTLLASNGFKLVRILEATVKTNPTMYYNAVYRKM